MKGQLRDIKPLVEIPDISLFLYWGIVIVCIVVIVVGTAFVVYKLVKMRKRNILKEYLNELYHIDFGDPKKAAYKITRYGRLLALDDRRKELFGQLENMLEKYKYKKNVEPIDRQTKSQFELFRKICDESI